MRRVQLSIGIVGGLILAGGCAVRAPKSNGMDQSAAIEGRSLGLAEVKGEVVAVDREAGRLRVRDPDDREIELRVSPSTPIFFQGGLTSFVEIAEGSPVRAAYSEEGTEKIASWVEIPRPDPSERPVREPLEPVDEPGETEAPAQVPED